MVKGAMAFFTNVRHKVYGILPFLGESALIYNSISNDINPNLKKISDFSSSTN